MRTIQWLLSLGLLLVLSCTSDNSALENERVRNILTSQPYWTFNTTEMNEMLPDTLETRDLRVASITTRNLEGVILEFKPDSTVTINIPAKEQQFGRWIISERGDSMSLMTGVSAPVFQFIQEIQADRVVLAANPEQGAIVPKVLYSIKGN